MKAALLLALWMGDVPVGDEQPWPVYLSESGMRDALYTQAALWPPCDPIDGAQTLSAGIVLDRDGKVREVSGDDGLTACWRQHLSTLDLGDHPEDGLQLRLSIYATQGRLQNILTLERQEQVATLPFIHLPMSLTISEKGRIRRALLLAYDRPEE